MYTSFRFEQNKKPFTPNLKQNDFDIAKVSESINYNYLFN